jgi:Domain of unknown function (DUF4190)
MANQENTNLPADQNTPAAGNSGTNEPVNTPVTPEPTNPAPDVPPPMTEPVNYNPPPTQPAPPPAYQPPQTELAPAPTFQAPPPIPNYAAAPAPETNTLAIISLVASILSWVLVPIVGGIVGVVTGFMARNQIRESNGQQTGDGLALTGIIVGAINLVVGCIGVLCFTVIIIGGFLSNSGR